MSLQRSLEECFLSISSNKMTDRKKGLERITSLLSDEEVIEKIAQNKSITWERFLDSTKNCLKQECERIAKKNDKTASRNAGDQSFALISDLFGLIIKSAFVNGYETINISKLIRYIDGCLKEKNMRICRDTFLVVMKDYILPNYMCLGYLDPGDFILIFELLIMEFNNGVTVQSNEVIVYNCFMLLLKYGPNCGLPANYLREQFAFMTKFCKSTRRSDPRAIHSYVMETIFYFCKYTVEDNRRSCIKLGEEVFSSLFNLYNANDHELLLKEKFLEFCLLQLTIHNPNGVIKGDSEAMASCWNTWNNCVKDMFNVLSEEILGYLRYSVKNTLFFKSEGTSTVILHTFVSLFVEVVNQLLNNKLSVSACSSMQSTEQPPKKRKVETTLETHINKIQETKNWIWIKLMGAVLHKYPQLISEELFLQLLRVLQSIQCEANDINTTNYIYECQGILIDVQKHLNLGHNEEITNLWHLVGKSALSAVELNQNIEATQILLQKLIKNGFIDLESTIQMYKPGVLTITKHHIKTVEVIFKHIQFPELVRVTRINILRSLLNFESAKDVKCFLEPDFATVLVSLLLKQYPKDGSNISEIPEEYHYLKKLYAKSNFNLKDIIGEQETDNSDHINRVYNVDSKVLEDFFQHITNLHGNFNGESAIEKLCIFGLLCNLLNSLIEYNIIAIKEVNQCELFLMMKSIISNENLVKSLNKYVTRDAKMLLELLELTNILDTIWATRNYVTDYVRDMTPLNFLQKLFEILNHLHRAYKRKVEQEVNVKLTLTKALSKFCVISYSSDLNENQVNIMNVLSDSDYDFSSDVDYSTSLCFLETIKYGNPGVLPEQIITNILECLKEICQGRYHSYENAKDILRILKDLYIHLDKFTNENHKETAIRFLMNYFDRQNFYSPDISVAILDCVETLCKVDPNFHYARWNDTEIIKIIPVSFLASEYQRVRYKAICVLVDFIKLSSRTNKLEDIHRIEELFGMMYENNLKVFEVEGKLTEDRKCDEIEFRTMTALHLFVSTMIHCHDWIDECLFALIKLERDKKLFESFDKNILLKITSTLELHFEKRDFLDRHLENILMRWLESGYNINQFPFVLFNCVDKLEFYKRNFDICVPLLIMKDRGDLIKAKEESQITENDILEDSSTKIFAKALTENITNIGAEFLQRVPAMVHLVNSLGAKLNTTLIENVDDVLLNLLYAISDSQLFHEIFQEKIIFVHNGISYLEFKKCLSCIKDVLFGGNNFMNILITEKMYKIQKMLLKLQTNVYNAIAEKKLKHFHQYAIFVDMISKNIKSHHKLTTYFIRDTIYYLIHLVKNEINDLKLSQVVTKYIEIYLRNIPDKMEEFKDFAIFTINSIKNVALLNDHVTEHSIRILEYLIVDNESLHGTIEKLDKFPLKPEFERLNETHTRIKYLGKNIMLEDEIKSFVEYDRDMISRQDSLKHLKTLLATKKDQLKTMYDQLDTINNSDHSTNSLLHCLTCMLVKMSCCPNRDINIEAIKCLGELGPANLNSLVLQPNEKVLDIKAIPFELLTHHILSLLTQYIVDEDIALKAVASKALYAILKYKETIKIAGSTVDFGYGRINKSFIIPYLTNENNASHIRFKSNVNWMHDKEIWCPSRNMDNNLWITTLVLELLKTFNKGSYLENIIPLCKIKAKFCENILPLLVYLLLDSNNHEIVNALSRQINIFFENHWTLTVPDLKDDVNIALNKKAVKCMLTVINFIRQQLTNDQSFRFEGLNLNYLYISKAAAFCSAHFTAVLYGELWCRKQISLSEGISQTPDIVKSGYSLLDYVYENQNETVGITLQDILQNAYKAIGDLDSLSGCGFMFLLHPEYKVEHYKKLGQWDKVMNYYSSQSTKYTDNNCANLIESFKMNQFYQLPVLCSQLSSVPQYECLWRLGQWNTSGNDVFKNEKNNLKNYEKYQFNSLKALVDGDRYTFQKSKEEFSASIIENLKHTSFESSKNLYPILMQLQSLVEMDDFAEAMENKDFNAMFNKWEQQDLIIRKNDFEFTEPIVAQRFTLLGVCIRKYPQLREKYFKMALNFAEYARKEHHIRVAENAIANIKKEPDLEDSIRNELQFRDSQIAWLNNDKMIAQQLIRRLSKNDITPRLKAAVLKTQAEHMSEIYSDRSTILETFSASINLLKNMNGEFTQEDRQSYEDTFDKIASFADKEYQQIVNHMKSDLFQKKVANMKRCKERIGSIHHSRMTNDEKKAAVLQQRQTKIEEEEINNTKYETNFVLRLAVLNYLKNLLLCDTNNIKIFRVMSLLLDNRDNNSLAASIKESLSKIPTYKYVMMLPQLIPHISRTTNDFFSQQINMIIEKCANDHPHHTLPLLLALVNANKDQEYTSSKTKKFSNDRVETANFIINKLVKHKQLRSLINKMKVLSDALIELAYFVDSTRKDQDKAYSIPAKLKIHKIKDFSDVLVPTCTLSVKKNNIYENVEGIMKFVNTYRNVGGINSPKRIECVCTTGKSRSQLVKGQDDLRQDAVMEQVFSIITDLLSGNKQTKNMLIRTYKIVPLSMRSGVLEWVANSMPIGNYLAGNKQDKIIGAHRKFRPDDKTPDQCRYMFRDCANKTPAQKLEVFNSICERFKPVFHKFFETHFPQPSVWYEKRKAYTYSVATTSMCGYILGIGDRHVSNILIDKQSAELVHIDFGIAFEQGKCLPTPETVPFRLTRDIVDAMGVSGVEGLFRKSCEKTMEVLRVNSQTILTILEVLLYDPLYFWTVTPAEANKRQTEEDLSKTNSDEQEEENKNISAETALLRLRGKLQGTEEGKPTSVEQQVATLIQQAMDPANLCKLYNGWQPYL